jgi:hypothetical protein
MKRHLLLPLLLLSSSLCRAQEYIPFTATEGVRTAQATLGVQSAPALVGTPQVDTAGYSLFWYYTFPDADSAAVVVRRADSTFWGGRVGIEDTAWIPVHVRGASLPSWANSTTAMERIRGVEEFQQWAAQYFDRAQTILLAGWLRRPLRRPPWPSTENDAVWVFIGQDTVGAGTTLLCWCSAEPGSSRAARCRRLDSGFVAFEGVPAAQALLGTRAWPSLAISGEEGVDLYGRARTWVYVFPMPDSLAIVVVHQSLLDFEAALWGGQIGDTVEFQQQFPFYVRSSPPIPPIVDSYWAMYKMSERPQFQSWLGEHGYASRRAILVGGVPLPSPPWDFLPGGEGYGWYLTVTSQDGMSTLRCWLGHTVGGDCLLIYGDCTIVSVREESGAGITVVPNPASDVVLVQAPGAAPLRLQGIYTLLGERVSVPTTPLSADTLLLDVRSLPSGVYTLSIELGNRLLRSQLRVLR